MRGPGIFLVLGDYGATEVTPSDEKYMPKATLAV
jgi:hypothetical protein